MSSIVEVSHPLIRSHLSRLRDAKTPPAEFRQQLGRLATLLAYEATRDLEVEAIEVDTPLMPAVGHRLKQRIALAPILRAGLGMVDPVLSLIPSAEVWHLGLYRDEKTAQPVEYYCKLPNQEPVDLALILDPMLATGGSASVAIEALHQWGVTEIKLLCVIAAPEGIDHIEAAFPGVQIFACAIDDRLNDLKFILPGLGDAGDRAFNTTG